MKVYIAPLSNGSFAIQDFPDGSLRVVTDCAGTDLGSAVQVPSARFSRVLKQTIIANWVDASNFGLAFPYIDFGLYTEIEIWAMGPDGESITVFFQGDNKLVDASTSIDIPTGTAKKFMAIGGLIAISTFIGVMG
jgi:hypothetical protein